MESLKTTIRNAFANVRKDGIGVREATAIDDWATAEERLEARNQDCETHWWEIPEEWRSEVGTALSFTDKGGFRFLLPAAMTAAIDEVKGDIGHSVFYHLVLRNHATGERSPHHGYVEYIDFLKRISASGNAQHFELDAAQLHAVAEFLNWRMSEEKSYLYKNRDEEEKSRAKSNRFLKDSPRENYRLSVEDEMRIFDEECRILREWLDLGGVSVKS